MKFLFLILFLSILTDAIRYKCNKNLSCGCSYSNVEINARIINGEEAIPYSWSMIVSLRYDFFHDGNFARHACGGTILTDSYILTAASCLETIGDDVKSANVTIAAGIHKRSEPMQIIRQVDDILIHPNWTSEWHHDYDIALLHLAEPLNFQMNSFISRTCLSSKLDSPEELLRYPPINTTLAVVGWGRTSSTGDDSDILRQIIVSSIDNNSTKCMDKVVDPIRQFCARSYYADSGPCYGDFGGPIFQWIEDHWEQVGIGSFTPDGCRENSFVGYTRIAYYRDWIEENIQNHNETTEEIVTTTSQAITEKPADIYQCDRYTVSCGCGRRDVQISQTDNTEAIPYSWSMIVSIRLNNQNKHSCSGSILSESYILTSASCIANVSSFGITIVAGIHNHSEDDGIYRKVDQIYFHPNYTGLKDNNANDIAILHISQTLNFNNNLFINQICLQQKSEVLPDPIFYPIPGARLVVIGWGLMNCENKSEQQLLQQVQVYTLNDLQENCYILNKHRKIQFCAGLNNGNTVPCVRDPGSPIFQWLENRWQQVGITSYVIDCIQSQNIGIYTRLIEYKDWIQSITNTYSTTSSTTVITPNPTTISVKDPNLYRCNETLTCGCGPIPVILTPPRIVGGEKAVDYSWPMMVSIQWPKENNHWCGGTILSNSYILTAAHCLYRHESNPPVRLSISVGMTDLLDSKQIRRTVNHIYIHPNYTGINGDYRHDIAIVYINQSLPIEDNFFLTKTCIHPLNPPMLNDQYIKNGTRLTTIGWGVMKEGAIEAPTLLQQVEVYAIDNEDPTCIDALIDSQTQFCAGLIEGGKDACQGDSGGPIFQWTGYYWEQVGIVSNGDGCAEAGKPGIYTRLSYYYDWINNILKNDNEHLEPEFPSNQTSIKADFTTTFQMNSNSTTTPLSSYNITSTSPMSSNTTTPLSSYNITSTSQMSSNTTTVTIVTTPTVKSDAYTHQNTTFLFSVLFVLFRMILH